MLLSWSRLPAACTAAAVRAPSAFPTTSKAWTRNVQGGAQPPRPQTVSGEPLFIGHVYETERNFTQAEVDSFVALTGDTNEIHRHASAAESLGFPAPILPGMLGASLFPAIVGSKFPGSIYYGQTLRFLKPAFVGRAVKATVEVTDMKPLRGGRWKVVFSTELRSIQGEGCTLVHTGGNATAIIPQSTLWDVRGLKQPT